MVYPQCQGRLASGEWRNATSSKEYKISVANTDHDTKVQKSKQKWVIYRTVRFESIGGFDGEQEMLIFQVIPVITHRLQLQHSTLPW